MFLSTVSSGFILALDAGGRLGGTVASACDEFEDNEGGTSG